MIVGTFSNDEASIMNICHNLRNSMIVEHTTAMDLKQKTNALSITSVEASWPRGICRSIINPCFDERSEFASKEKQRHAMEWN
jgi:hypothetical protein